MNTPTGAPDALLRAVQEAAAAEYDVLGEMGRGERGLVAYLARERASDRLVVLRLRQDAGELHLSVARELDATVPAAQTTCPGCGAPLASWGRFCASCGRDLTRLPLEGKLSPAEMLEAARRAAGDEYEILGEMPQADGAGAIFFAREQRSHRLVALRLERTEREGVVSFSLGLAQALKPLAASLGVSYASPERGVVRVRTAPPPPPAPKPHRPTLQPVIIPDPTRADEPALAPPAPGRRVPVFLLALIAAALIGGVVLYALSDRAPSSTSTEPPDR